MFFDLFIKSKGSLATMDQAVTGLRSSGAFAALSELGHTRSVLIPSPAASKHWNDGYQEALKDIFHFGDRYTNIAPPADLPRADFSVASTLFRNGEITAEEYERLTGRKPSSA